MKNFDGHGFSTSSIEGEDAAKARHIMHELDEIWPYVKDTATLQKAFKILQSSLKVGLGIALPAFGIAAYAASKGWIG